LQKQKLRQRAKAENQFVSNGIQTFLLFGFVLFPPIGRRIGSIVFFDNKKDTLFSFFERFSSRIKKKEKEAIFFNP
jgi:hypothetical protein